MVDLDRSAPAAVDEPTGLCLGCGRLAYAHTPHAAPACGVWPGCRPGSEAFAFLRLSELGLTGAQWEAAYELATVRAGRPEMPVRDWLAMEDDERAAWMLEAVAWTRAAAELGGE